MKNKNRITDFPYHIMKYILKQKQLNSQIFRQIIELKQIAVEFTSW